MLGAAAGLLLGLVEVAWLLATAGASFDGARETAELVALTLAVLAGAGTLVGAVEGLLCAAVEEAAAALGDPRRDAVWHARLYTALAVPPIALVCAQIFAGPRARTIAHHDLYAVAIGVVALAAWFSTVRAWQRLHRGERSRRLVLALALAAALLALVVYAADQKILVRLYPFFHHGLGFGAFAAAQAALALVWLGLRRRLVRLVEPSTAAALACLLLALGASALGAISHRRALRTVVLERAALLSPIVRAVHRAEPSRAASVAAADGAPAGEGPHLGPVDIFLVTIDAMRADRLNARVAPHLTALAARGVVFERAYTEVPHTSFSIATLLTGKYVYALSALGLDAAAHETLPEVLKRERYKTAGFYPPSVFTIDRERLAAMEQSAYGFEYVKYEHMDAPGRTQQVIDFLEREHPARAFVWVHYFEPHEPYDRHPGHFDDARDAAGRYDGEVHFVDAEVQRLVDYVQRTRPRAIVVVAADHGEEFGEHGGRYHGTTLYEEQVRVPLVFVSLGGALPPHRVAAPVSLIDVMPTLLSLVGIVPSVKLRGHDLGPWLQAAPPAAAGGSVFGEINQQKMIVSGDHKLVCDLSTEACSAFDLAADPGERKNRIDAPFAAELKRRLDGFIAEESRFESGGSPVDARTRKLIERARLGDKTVARELAPLVGDATLRPEVTRLLATLPPEPATRAALERVSDDAWADLALARLGDLAARKRLLPALEGGCADRPAEWCARAALAVGDVAALGDALARELDEPLQLEVVAALGRSHDPRALDPLVIQLGRVRTRLQTVAALAELDDARALPTLLRWVPNEPYVPVRARMVSLVAQLARRSPAEARAVLMEMAASEHEAPVMGELVRALHAFGAPSVTEPSRARAVAGGELWIVGSGDGALDVGGTRVDMHDGVARVAASRAGRVTVRRLDGDAAPALVFSRRAP